MTPELLAAASLYHSKINRHDFRRSCSEIHLPPGVWERASIAVSWCEQNNARILYPGHPDYPVGLEILERPPLFLSCWGEPVWLNRKTIAVVGSRDVSSRAGEWMERHLAEFARRSPGVSIVSGGARGVDQKAHAICIRAGQPTIAVVPTGLQNIYPSEFKSWKDEIVASGGAIVSPYAPEQEIRRAHFEGRNRIIVALSQLVFVVEAKRKSGSIMTARLARELSRTLCTLPGFPTDTFAAGNVDLLFDGVFPLRDSEDLMALYSLS